MYILCEVGLVLALLVGGLIGLTLTQARYDHIAMRQRQYEAEAARDQELYAALALYRRFQQHNSADDKVPAAPAAATRHERGSPDGANGGPSGSARGRPRSAQSR